MLYRTVFMLCETVYFCVQLSFCCVQLSSCFVQLSLCYVQLSLYCKDLLIVFVVSLFTGTHHILSESGMFHPKPFPPLVVSSPRRFLPSLPPSRFAPLVVSPPSICERGDGHILR